MVANSGAARRLTWGVQVGVALVLLLLAFGWWLVPAVPPIAPAAVLIAYAVVAHPSTFITANKPRGQWVTLAFGGVSAAVLVRSLVVQYFGDTADNAVMVTIVFGLWLLSGIATAGRTGRIRDAVVSSTLSAQIASLTNVGVILASYYVLRGSPLQERFFRTEGSYEDFARSGVSDFGVFMMGDLFGGAFFHLLFGALFGALLGMIAGAMTVGVTRVLNGPGGLPNRRLHPTASSNDEGRG
jgi:hypothetical protein